MSRTWNTLSPGQQVVAKGAVGALLTIDALSILRNDTDRVLPQYNVTFRDLLAWVQGEDSRPSREIQNAIAKDQRLARDLERLLHRTAGWYGARAAAASSGALDVREGDGFHLRLKTSRAGGGQVYLLIEVIADRQPTTLVIRGPSGEFVKVALPSAQNRMIQILAEDADEEIHLLRDPGSELFLW